MWEKILLIIIIIRDGENQNINGININPINVLVQLNGIFMIVVDGSKIENKLFIIFSVFF